MECLFSHYRDIGAKVERKFLILNLWKLMIALSPVSNLQDMLVQISKNK